MKLARCENGHLYPMDAYFDCPFCSGEIAEDELDITIPEPEHISEESFDEEEVEYTIESADPEWKEYRIMDKDEKEAMIKKAREEYIRTHDLHINSTKENTAVWLKEKTQGLRDAASVVSEIVENIPYLSDIDTWSNHFKK